MASQNLKASESGIVLGNTITNQKSSAKSQDNVKSAKRITGTVKWFNAKDGFGFITRHDTGEDVFVHKSSIMKPNRNHFTKSIGDGEIVEFGLIASKVTGPGFKAVKGSPFVAKRGGRRPSSRASQISKKNVDRVDCVGDGTEEMEKRTKVLSIQSSSKENKSEISQEYDHLNNEDSPSNETVSTSTSEDTEA